LSSAHRARAGFAPQRLRPGMLQHGRDATNRGAPRRSSRTRSQARGHPPPPYAPASCVGRCRSGGPPSRAPSTTGPTRPVWSEPSRADSPGAGSRPHGGRGRRRRSSPGAHGLTRVIPAGRTRGALPPSQRATVTAVPGGVASVKTGARGGRRCPCGRGRPGGLECAID
jgi:hypothetical protein